MSGGFSMMSRRGVVAGLIGAALVPHADAAEPSAQDFVGSIYTAYKGKDAKGVPLSAKGALAKYFTPSLVRLIDADAKAAARRGEVPKLDGDPFVDAQDWEINAFAIDVKDSGADKAAATVRFKNVDKDVTVALDLVKTKSGWRIDEIRGPSGSLRGLFNKK